MKVLDLLKSKKNQDVFTISPEKTVYEALEMLLKHQISSLMVCDDGDGKMLGIITERDILRAVYKDPDVLKGKQVKDLMTTNVIVAIPDDEIDYVVEIMSKNRFRHLPIVNKDSILGIVSIGDIAKFQLHEIQAKNRYLEEYMYGPKN